MQALRHDMYVYTTLDIQSVCWLSQQYSWYNVIMIIADSSTSILLYYRDRDGPPKKMADIKSIVMAGLQLITRTRYVASIVANIIIMH